MSSSTESGVAKYSDITNFGIFANQHIYKDSIIEECPLIKLDWTSKYIHDPVLLRCCFTEPSNKNDNHNLWLCCGYGMLYNTSNTPNTNIRYDFENKKLYIIANQDINATEEIYIPLKTRDYTTSISEKDTEDSDDVFMSKIEALMKQHGYDMNAKSSNKSPQQIQQEIQNYGGPLP
jgi:hypothetical protein